MTAGNAVMEQAAHVEGREEDGTEVHDRAGRACWVQGTMGAQVLRRMWLTLDYQCYCWTSIPAAGAVPGYRASGTALAAGALVSAEEYG